MSKDATSLKFQKGKCQDFLESGACIANKAVLFVVWRAAQK